MLISLVTCVCAASFFCCSSAVTIREYGQWRGRRRERESSSSNCRCFRLTTHSHGLMAWNCYRTYEWLAANIFRWEIEKHSRETGAYSQRREKNIIFEVKKQQQSSRRCAGTKQPFQKVANFALCNLRLREHIIFISFFLLLFAASLYHNSHDDRYTQWYE